MFFKFQVLSLNGMWVNEREKKGGKERYAKERHKEGWITKEGERYTREIGRERMRDRKREGE